jgi:hypothetical protein
MRHDPDSDATANADAAIAVENNQEWFWMLINYMKMKTLAIWLFHYPTTTYEEFELIWPLLLDQMLAQATAWTAKKLSERVVINSN